MLKPKDFFVHYKVHGNLTYLILLINIMCIAELLPEVEYIYAVQQKQLKKRMLEELPRRTSDRIAIKAAIREEEVWSQLV